MTKIESWRQVISLASIAKYLRLATIEKFF
jgi:hypothetical protein